MDEALGDVKRFRSNRMRYIMSLINHQSREDAQMNSTLSTQPAVADAPVPKIAEFLCFAIYSANLAFGRAYRPVLDQFGLTYTQYIAIIVLWEEGSQTVGALGEKLFLESNTLTPILKKLETMGYVQRQRDPADERQVLVTLTDAGRRLRERALCVSLVDATGLTPDEFAIMQKGVVKLRENLIEAAHHSD